MSKITNILNNKEKKFIENSKNVFWNNLKSENPAEFSTLFQLQSAISVEDVKKVNDILLNNHIKDVYFLEWQDGSKVEVFNPLNTILEQTTKKNQETTIQLFYEFYKKGSYMEGLNNYLSDFYKKTNINLAKEAVRQEKDNLAFYLIEANQHGRRLKQDPVLLIQLMKSQLNQERKKKTKKKAKLKVVK